MVIRPRIFAVDLVQQHLATMIEDPAFRDYCLAVQRRETVPPVSQLMHDVRAAATAVGVLPTLTVRAETNQLEPIRLK